ARSGGVRQLAEQVGLLAGQEAGAEEGRRALGVHQLAVDRVERVLPASGDQRRMTVVPLAADARAGQPRRRLVALEAGAAEIAHPVVVDLDVVARLVALDVAAPVLHRDVAPHLAAGADRRLLVEVPDALGEAEAGRGQGADRADVHHAGGERIVQLLPRKGADLGAGAAVEEAELRRPRDLLGEADAAGALDPRGPVEGERRGASGAP